MTRDKDFTGRVVLVTGAGTGIGKATALLLVNRGAKVTLVGRREEPLREVAAEITREGGAALVFASDVANVEDAQRAVDLTVSTFGALHGAVNNAGVASESHELPSMPIDVWSDTIAVNLSAQFYGMRAQIPAIQRSGGGAIVNVSSVFADRGMRGRAAYSSSKHALRGLTRSAALEWAPRGVRINELQPGVIDTPMTAVTTSDAYLQDRAGLFSSSDCISLDHRRTTDMAAQLNHTIVWSSDPIASSRFLATMLGRPAPTRFAHFEVVALDNGVSLDFARHEAPVQSQHYAFLIGESDFDAVLRRIQEHGVAHWADPMQSRPGEINHGDGGRGVYFADPDGHILEVITRPYGGGGG